MGTRRVQGLGGWAVSAALVAGLLLRLWGLGHLPGVNGDEAWYAVGVRGWLAGASLERTPTGNLASPVHVALTLPVVALLPPSLVALRLPSLLTSLLALAALWALLRRAAGPLAAGAGVSLAALLPALLAYARFSWEPSHVPAVVALAGALAVRGWAVRSALAFLLAVLTHPTAVFAAPFLALAHLGAVWAPEARGRALARGALQGALMALALVLLRFTASAERTRVDGAAVLARLTDAGAWAEAGGLLVRLLTGDTTLRYVVGTSLPDGVQVAAAVALGLLLLLGGGSLVRRPDAPAAGLVAGALATLLAFEALAGAPALQPHYERYALVLLVPVLAAIAVLLREVAGRGDAPARAAVPVALACALGGAAFVALYLRPLAAHGGASQDTFWTGASQEPKAAAVAHVLREAGGAPARLVAESFWVYWPAAYFAGAAALQVEPFWHAPPPADPAFPGGTWWLGFVGGPLEAALGRAGYAPRWEARAGNGRVLLRLWRTDGPRVTH
jgi:hypothetical protein